MNDATPATTTKSGATKIGAALFVAALAALALLYALSLHRTAMAVPAAITWAAALYAIRPMVAPEKRAALYFAFGVMAFLIFFLHESYAFTGKVRYFPLIVGWTGMALSALDIFSLTETRLARGINLVFGTVPTAAPGEGRRAGREIACFAAMAGSVVLIWLFGFLIGAPLFVLLWMRLWGRKSVRISLYGAAGTFAFIWLLFEGALRYQLYRGEVVIWLLDRIQG